MHLPFFRVNSHHPTFAGSQPVSLDRSNMKLLNDRRWVGDDKRGGAHTACVHWSAWKNGMWITGSCTLLRPDFNMALFATSGKWDAWHSLLFIHLYGHTAAAVFELCYTLAKRCSIAGQTLVKQRPNGQHGHHPCHPPHTPALLMLVLFYYYYHYYYSYPSGTMSPGRRMAPATCCCSPTGAPT